MNEIVSRLIAVFDERSAFLFNGLWMRYATIRVSNVGRESDVREN